MAFEIIGGQVYDLETGDMVGALPMLNLNRGLAAQQPLRLSPQVLRSLGQRLNQMPAIRQATVDALGSSPRLVERSPGRIDETPLPITATAVASGASQDISVNSQIIFSPRRLIVPDSIESFFTIDAFSVGNVPLFAGNGSIPAEAFRPDSVNPNVRKVTAQPGVPITLRVTNIDAVQHTFRAAVFGEGAQPYGC